MKVLRSLTLSRLVMVVTIAAIFAMAARTPLDTDLLWHLRAGQWQVEHRAILTVDLFSHSRYGEAWVNHSWLSQIILYAAYALLGDLGLLLYTALLATAGMTLVYLMCEGNAFVRGFVTILAGATAAVFWSPRPQMISFFLSTVVLYLLWLYRQGKDRLWLIPPLMILWANLHGGFAIGFILMVLTTIGEGARWLFDGVLNRSQDQEAEQPTLRPVWRLVVVGLISAAVVGLNPYGPRMLLYPFQTVGIGVLQDFIREWASPNFHLREMWPFIWLLLGTFLAVGFSPERLDWRDAILFSGTAYSALLAGRNIALFAVVAAPVMALHLSAWLAGQPLRLEMDAPPEGVRLALNWGLIVLGLVAVVVKVSVALAPETLDEAERALLPVDAVAYLEEHRPPGPLFNSYNWGGYLIWAARDYPVYVDGRTDLYGDELLRTYLKIYFAQSGWEDALADTGANTVLIETGSPLAQVLALSEGWQRAYTDEMASIYVWEGASDD